MAALVKVKVVELDPGLKGDTSPGGTKPGTVEASAVVNVLLFVDRGQEIVVDIRTGQYVGRAFVMKMALHYFLSCSDRS
ncbi:elongation factor P (EF-P) family protein [Artemisia annua]|uniref:Elongation factor P (EF-P) family protein n=1 Tax=Artemisia annua TaxID=35608 RepID=A0A2U1NN37_ARTAN|nr:elongation factor P (EF-P) family protein [Artemisia annua]